MISPLMISLPYDIHTLWYPHLTISPPYDIPALWYPLHLMISPPYDMSVYLRTVSAPLASAWLAATYHACLWSIRACTVTSPHTSLIQATAARPHGCNIQAKFDSQRVPTLFSGKFCKLSNKKLTLGMIVDDLPRWLFIAAFVFQLRTRDHAVRSAELAFITIIYLLQRCLQITAGRIESIILSFICPC